jgi:hypothetical protein
MTARVLLPNEAVGDGEAYSGGQFLLLNFPANLLG